MILELSFPVYGDAPLPADHHLLLFEALTAVVPSLRHAPDVNVLPLSGRHAGDRYLLLMPYSELTLRLPDVRIGEFLVLSRSRLETDRLSLRLGTARVRLPHDAAFPVSRTRRPSPSLTSGQFIRMIRIWRPRSVSPPSKLCRLRRSVRGDLGHDSTGPVARERSRV